MSGDVVMADVKIGLKPQGFDVRPTGPTFVARTPARPETRSHMRETELKFGRSWIEPNIVFGSNGEIEMSCYLRGNTPLVQIFSNSVEDEWESGQVFQLYGKIVDNGAAKHFWIGGFYSRIHRDRSVSSWATLANPSEQGLLGGIGFSSLCYLLRAIRERNMVSLNTIVALEASGWRLKDLNAQQSMIGLVNYYTSLGFSYVQPQALFYELLGKGQFREEIGPGVLMGSTVRRILDRCPQSKQVVVPAALPAAAAVARFGGSGRSGVHNRFRR